jgi:hypothetical protein
MTVVRCAVRELKKLDSAGDSVCRVQAAHPQQTEAAGFGL